MKIPAISLQHFRMVRSAVDSFAQDYSYSTKERAFLGLVLSEYLGLDEYDIDDSIIDGSYDGGIDAIYILPNPEERPKVYIFQSKYYSPTNEDKYDRNFEGGALTKMKEAVYDYIISGKKNKSYQNSALQDKLNFISQLDNPEFELVFCSNSNHPVPKAKEQFEDFIDEYNSGGLFYSVKYLHLAEVAKLLAPEQEEKIKAKLQFTGKFIDSQSGDARMFIGQVSADELSRLREKHGMNLFDRNVRGFLKNKLNTEIQETACGNDSGYFSYFNNGITISCDQLRYRNTTESPLVEIENLQIVNGGQTTNSLYQAYQSKRLKPDVTVLVRILHIQRAELLPKIILSTNSQTKVTSRDLRSNDEVQRILERELLGYGYYYEARKDKYKKTHEAFGKRVDALAAAQAYYAAHLGEPADAKNKKAQIFGDFYGTIFPNIRGDVLLLCYLLHEKIRKINKEYADKYTFLNDASLHILKVMYEHGLDSIEKLDSKDFDKIYKKAIVAINKVVKEKVKQEKDKYSHRRTFIDDNTKGRIEEVFSTR